MSRCHWCPEGELSPVAELIAVGFIEQGSGPGYTYYACPGHRDEHGMLALAQHPPDSDGRPRTVRAGVRAALHTSLPCCALIIVLAWLACRRP
jgi:hypothetical protein